MIWNKRLTRKQEEKRRRRIAKKIEKMKTKKNTSQMIEYTKPIILDEMSRSSGGVCINITCLNGEYEGLEKYFNISMRELINDKYFHCTSYDEMNNILHYSGHLTLSGRELLKSQQLSNRIKKSYFLNQLVLPIVFVVIGTFIGIFIAKVFGI